MLRTALKALAGIVVSILGVRLGNAILNAFDIKPELWILGQIMAVPTEAWLEVARWGIALAIALVIWLVWHWFLAKNDVWTERDQLELSAIANLSVGKSVDTPIDAEPQLSRHRSLKDAVMSGALKTINMRGKNPNVMSIITREDLRAYANSKNHNDLLNVLKKWDRRNPPNPERSQTSPTKKITPNKEQSTAPKAEQPFIEFSKVGSGSSVIASHNVTSLADNGIGHYSITFGKDFPSDKYAVLPLGKTPRNFEIVGQNKSSITIKFDHDPQYVGLRFQD